MKINKIKGTRDILPEEIDAFTTAENILRETMDKYEYREIRTPIFEHSELFIKTTGAATDIVKKEMYSFTDRGGRNISLRPEGTPSVIRAYLENSLDKKKLFQKFFYYGPMFRQENPQSGRLREFRQFGIEAIGSKSPQIDAETIILGIEVLKNIGLEKVELHLNNIGCEKCRPSYESGLKSFLQPKLPLLCDDCKKRFNTNILRVLDCKKQSCKELTKDAPKPVDYLCQECSEHFAQVINLLKKSDLSYILNPHLVRGLDYYTKTVYEFISPILGAQDAVGGGGRYDKMIESFGGSRIPAIGFACGMERILLAAQKQEKIKTQNKHPKCYIVTMDAKSDEQGFLLLGKLRKLGIRCEKDFMSKSLKAQMKDANKLKAEFACIIGSDEIEKNEVTLKRMDDGTQKRIAFSVDEIRKEIDNGQ